MEAIRNPDVTRGDLARFERFRLQTITPIHLDEHNDLEWDCPLTGTEHKDTEMSDTARDAFLSEVENNPKERV